MYICIAEESIYSVRCTEYHWRLVDTLGEETADTADTSAAGTDTSAQYKPGTVAGY